MRRAALAVSLLLAAARAWAGAWTLPQGGWFLEETVSRFTAQKDFNASGETVTKPFNGVYSEIRAKNYLEYGLHDRLTLLASLPYRRSRFVDDYNDISQTGFMDASLGAKWRWLPHPWAVSFGAGLSFPTGYNRNAPLALGKGRMNPELRGYVSRFVGERVMVGAELAKDRYGLPYLVECTALASNWGFLKFYVNGLQDLPRHPDSERYAKWNLAVGLTSEGSNAIMRSTRQKSSSLSIGTGRVFDGRNSGRGSDLILSAAFGF